LVSNCTSIVDDFVMGIPRLAKLQDSDDSFRIARRFGPQAFRILLRKQIEIDKLANELDRLDVTDEATKELEYRVHSVYDRESSDFEKSKLMEEIEVQIYKYCKQTNNFRSKRVGDLTLKGNRRLPPQIFRCSSSRRCVSS
jgi:hypothetical protein